MLTGRVIVLAVMLSSWSVVMAQAADPPAKPTPEQQKKALLDQIAGGKNVSRALWGLYAGRFEDAYPVFYDVFRTHRDPRVRQTALMLMWRRRMPGLDRAVTAAVVSDDAGLVRMGLDYLSAARDIPAAAAAVRKHLASDDVEMRWLAAKALTSLPGVLTRLPDEARRLAADPDVLIRQAFLANVAPGDGVAEIAVPLLLKALADPDAMTCMAAAQSLGRLGAAGKVDAALLDRLIRRLGGPEETPAGAAGYALKTLWTGEIERRIRHALAADDLTLRVRAADLLRKRKLPFDPGALGPAIARGSEDQQLYACGTLARVQSEGCVPVAAAALGSPHAAVRQSAVYALEVMAYPSAVAALVEALEHDDANVRRRAAIVLGRRTDARSAHAALAKRAAEDKDPGVRRAARTAAALVAGDDLAGVLAEPKVVLEQAAKLPPRGYDLAAGKPTDLKDGVAMVGTAKQLFVDDLVLDDLGGATRRLHKFVKDPRNPVLEQRYPWEIQGTLSYCTTVRYDPATRLFTFWYTSLGRVAAKGEAIASRAQLIAYSTDGIEWVRPHVGEYEYAGRTANNLVGRASNIVVIPKPSDPAQRYASYIWHPRFNALSVSFSPDGIRGWSDWQRVCGGGKDVVTACRDDLNDGYFSFMKWRVGRWYRRSAWAAWGDQPTAMRRGPINIVAGFADDRGSADRIAANFPGCDFFEPSRFHAEIYEVTPFIYEGHYLGLPVRFDVSGPGGGNVDGPTELCLMAGRDRRGAGGWVRPGGPDGAAGATGDVQGDDVQRLVPPLHRILDHGRWGEWDATQFYGPSSLLVVDDRIVLYYTGASFGHEPEGSRSDAAGKNVYRTAIGRATLRLDGFVSLHAGDQEATVTTKPLVFKGKELIVNVACPNGRLSVELLDKEGKPIPGHDAARADGFTGDALRHVVSWAGASDLARLAGAPVRLRFRLTNGELYAFAFRP